MNTHTIHDFYAAVLVRGCEYRVRNGRVEWINEEYSDHHSQSAFDGVINKWVVDR